MDWVVKSQWRTFIAKGGWRVVKEYSQKEGGDERYIPAMGTG
jgi:hypothetical protein